MADEVKKTVLWGSKVETQSGNSQFYVKVTIEQRNFDTYAEIRWWYGVCVWKGNFSLAGTTTYVKTSWFPDGTTYQLGSSTGGWNNEGIYAYNDWSAWTKYNYGENVPFNAQWASYPDGTHKSQTSSYYLVESPAWKPNAPTGGSATRSRDTLVNLAWTNNPTASRPYESLVIERRVNGGNWTQLKTVGANVTSATDTTTSANNTYQYRIKAANKNASSDYLTLGTVYMTPSAPTRLTWSRVSDTTVRLNFTNNANTATGLRIEAKTYGADDSTYQLVTTVSGKVTTADITLGANADGYAVRIANTRGTLMSGWLTSTKVVTVTPPNAPTLLAPGSSEIVRKDMESVTLEWAHNPVDGSAQTGVVVEYSTDNATWTVLAAGATASSATLSLASIAVNATVYWRVKTKGAHANYGAYSQSQFIVRQVPSVGVTSPSTIVTTTPVHYRFTYDDVSGSMRYHVLSITDSNGNVVFTKTVQGAETEGVIERDEFLLDDGGTYTLSVTALSTSTLESTGTSTFEVLYELPVNANIELEQDIEEGAVIVKASPKEREYSAQGAFTSNGYEQVGFMSPNDSKNLITDLSLYDRKIDEKSHADVFLDDPTFKDGVNLVGKVTTPDIEIWSARQLPSNPVVENFIAENSRKYAIPVNGGRYYSLSMRCYAMPGCSLGSAKYLICDSDYRIIEAEWATNTSGQRYAKGAKLWPTNRKMMEEEYNIETGGSFKYFNDVDYLKPLKMPVEAAYIVLVFESNSTIYTANDKRIYDIQLEQSETPTAYENPRYFPQLEPLEKKDSLDSLTINGSAERIVSRNLLVPSTYTSTTTNGVTFTKNDDGSWKVSGTATALTDRYLYNNMPPFPAGEYQLSNGSSNVKIYFADKTVSGSTNYYGTGGPFTLDGTGTWSIFLRVDSGTTVNETVYPQLELGSTATDYEPYFAPYVDVVRGRNLLLAEVGGIDVATAQDVDNSSRLRQAGYIKVSPNTEYTMSRAAGSPSNWWILGYKSDKTPITDGNFNARPAAIYTLQENLTKHTFTTTATTEYIRWYTTGNTDKDMQIERGSVATPYVPYGQLGVGLVGKNMLDSVEIQTAAKTSAGLTTEYAGDGWFSVNGESTASGANASLIMYGGNTGYVSSIALDNRHGSSPKQFTLGFDIDGTWPDSTTCRVQVMYYVDGDFSNGIGAYAYKDRPVLIVVPAGSVFSVSRVCVYRASGSAGSVFDCRIRPMLAEGSEESDYEPYVEGRYGIDLAGNVLASLPNGVMDVLRKDTERTYIEKRVGVVDLGTLNWSRGTGTNRSWFTAGVSGKAYGHNVITAPYEVQAVGRDDVKRRDKTISGSSNGTAVNITDDSYADATAFKAAMQGVLLYYELAEPYIVELEHGEEIRLLKPTTYMNVDTVRDTEVTAVVVRGGIVASSFDIQRISGNGNVTILSDATGAVEFADRYAPANTDYQYRVVTYADSGAFDSTYIDARLDTPYWYLVGDEVVAKAKYNPGNSTSIECADFSAIRYAGRTYPVLYDSDRLDEKFSASGIVIEREEMEKFRTLQRLGGMTVYKSNDGDVAHVHGATSISRVNGVPISYEVECDLLRIDGGEL